MGVILAVSPGAWTLNHQAPVVRLPSKPAFCERTLYKVCTRGEISSSRSVISHGHGDQTENFPRCGILPFHGLSSCAVYFCTLNKQHGSEQGLQRSLARVFVWFSRHKCPNIHNWSTMLPTRLFRHHLRTAPPYWSSERAVELAFALPVARAQPECPHANHTR